MKQKQRDDHGARRTASAAHAGEGSRVNAPGDPPAQLAHESVARRAYELYVSRGAEAGRELEDWFRAEAELLGGGR